MMRPITILSLFLLPLFLSSCFKEDRMVEPHPRGDVQTDTIPMTENYLHQVFFSLDSARMVKTVVKTTYDLGFDCSADGWLVILNTSNFMKAADLGEVPFGQAYDTTGLKMRFDKSDGNPDSNAIGRWYTVQDADTVGNRHVYAISRGLDELGNPLGLCQVIFDSLKNSTYYFRYAPLKGGAVSNGTAVKDPSVNYVFFSIKTGSMAAVEPPKETYDLLFSQYTTLLFTSEGIPYPYLVTGVMLNRHTVVAAADSSAEFSTITREVALTMNFTKALDVIGYDWKYYNFTTGVYTIRPNRNYVIRGISGFCYKLRFIGFYNGSGLKGYPVIEYQRL